MYTVTERILCLYLNACANSGAQIRVLRRLAGGGSCLMEYLTQNTDMRRLTTGIYSEICVVRRFRRCANVIECTYTNLDSIAYYTPRLYGIAYCS